VGRQVHHRGRAVDRAIAMSDRVASQRLYCTHVCFQIGVCESILDRDTLFGIKRLKASECETRSKRMEPSDSPMSWLRNRKPEDWHSGIVARMGAAS
jgi:hypothetical protein